MRDVFQNIFAMLMHPQTIVTTYTNPTTKVVVYSAFIATLGRLTGLHQKIAPAF